MKKRVLVGMLVVLGVSLATARWAMSQATIDRVESQIRDQTPGAVPAAGARPYLGAVVDDRNDRGRGVRVLSVRPGGPADRAGLRPDDLITAASEARIRQLSDLTVIVGQMSPGDKLAVEVLRAGSNLPQKGEITLGQASAPAEMAPGPIGAAPPPPAAPAEGPALNLVPGSADPARIDQLQRRIEQLERRVDDLERALGQPRKP